MSYRAETYNRVGNGGMGKTIKALATSCHLLVRHYRASGWVLKDITITVYGHEDDLKEFERKLPKGVQG